MLRTMFEGRQTHRAGESGDGLNRRPFLDSHGALAVRRREFERLTDAIMRGAAALSPADAEPADRAVMRRSPDRCIVQLGPAALTVAWLRGALDSVAGGELLVIVWRGVIAATRPYGRDRTTAQCTPVRSATALWEEVLAAAGTDEASWLWRRVGAGIGGFSSADLTERCVDRLRQARDGAADWLAHEGEPDR
jgi:hypothetical protein